MTLLGWAQIALVLAGVLAAAVPLGRFIARVAAGERTVLHPLLSPLERGLYAAAGVDPARGQDWKAYACSMLAFSAAGFALLYAILRLQGVLPLNPRGFGGMSPYLAFNTAVSFVTNTNWQAYGGESAASYLSQMAGFTVQNFVSAATGIALALALSRAFAAGKLSHLGNFWADLTRITLYVLLPLSVVVGLAFVALGMPQTLGDYATAMTLDGGTQTIPLGPVAFQVAIKHLGTNGGGFFGVNSLHPFEGPDAIATALQIWCQALIPFALCLSFGAIVGNRRQGWVLLAVMLGFVLAATAAIYAAEAAGNPLHLAAGLDPALSNMEGKDVRFGQAL
ncbi:MAG: potassium-transporting ATPase subunit KdpA, partial [Alphaproteobacteria bacterium]